MKKLLELLKKNPHAAVSAPAILCFITFCTNLRTALSDGNIDANEFSGLLSTIDGFETVVLFVVMIVLKSRDK